MDSAKAPEASGVGFSDAERHFISEQKLIRIATVSKSGQPDVAPVGFEFDGQFFYVGGRWNETTRKFKNVRDGARKVALALDDLAGSGSWKPRGIRIHGTGEIVERDGRFGAAKYIKVAPRISWSWGLDGTPTSDGPNLHRAVHAPVGPGGTQK